MPEKMEIVDAPFVRDMHSKAIHPTSRDALSAYERKVAAREQQQNDIDTLKHEVSELKELLYEVLQKLG